jgi:hypothetical protein
MVRSAMFRLVEFAAREDYNGLAATAGSFGDADAWADALDPLYVEQGDDAIGFDADARSSAFLTIVEEGGDLPSGVVMDDGGVVPAGQWWVRQILDDEDDNHDWAITALIDLNESDATESLVVRVTDVGPIS